MSAIRKTTLEVLAALAACSAAACSLVTSTDQLTGRARLEELVAKDAAVDDVTATEAPPSDLDGGAEVAMRATDAADATDAAADAGAALPSCPAVDDESAIFVDANLGNDTTGDGHSVPYRSITKALAVANATTGKIICVRGGTPGAPNVHSEATTGEVFPLRFESAHTTLRGEGSDRVRISFSATAADGGANAPEPGPNRPSRVAAWVFGPAHDVTMQGFELSIESGAALFSIGPNLKISHARFAMAPGIVASEALVSVHARAIVESASFSGQAVSAQACLMVMMAPLSVADSQFVGCRIGIYSFLNSQTTVDRSKFSRCAVGIDSHTAQSLTTSDNLFDSNTSKGIGVSYLDTRTTPYTWTSLRDTFVANGAGTVISCGTTPAGSSVTVTDALFRLTKNAGVSISCPIGLTLRGSRFEDGMGAAVNVLAPTSPTEVDLGDVDAGNVFQTTAKPNGAGVCLSAAGTLLARGSGFGSCPAQAGSGCAGGADVSIAADGGAIDTTGCFVAP